MSSIRIQGRQGVEELPLEEFERRVRLGELEGDTLVSLEVVTGRRFLPLRELELYQTLADPEAARFRARFDHLPPLLTALLVGLQIRVTMWSVLPSIETFIVEHLTNSAPAVLETGEVYRLLSYGFMHVGLTHLALNMLFLAYAGTQLERALGWRNLLTIWLVAVLSGGLLSMLMSPGRPSLGASGGDFGLIAATVVLGWKFEDQLPERVRLSFGWAMLPYLVYPLFLGLTSSAVDNWGHLGGLVGGGVMATFLMPDSFARHQGPNRLARRLAFAASALTLGGLALEGHRLVPLAQQDLGGLEVAYPATWRAGWTLTDDWGRLSETRQAGFVATTRTYDRPITPEDARRTFIEQLDSRAEDVQVVQAEPLDVNGWPALRLDLRYRVGGRDQAMQVLLITRGAQEYRVHLNAAHPHVRRYAALADRLLEHVALHDPPDLLQARAAAEAHRRSWRTARELGRAAARAGHPDEALEAFERAWRYAGPRRSEVTVDLLDFLGDHPALARPERVEELLRADAGVPEVVVEGARTWARLGRTDARDEVLREALQRWPEDLRVQLAAERAGVR